MRLNQIAVSLPEARAVAHQHMLVRHRPSVGKRRAIWSALHLLGAGLFLLAMFTHLAQAEPTAAPDLITMGGVTFTISERPWPFDPHMH